MRVSLPALAFLVTVCLLAFLPNPLEAGNWPDSCGNETVHNFEFGHVNFGDWLLNRTEVIRPSSFLRVISFDVNINTSGKISYIEVLDHKKDGYSGCVYLNGGGVGFNNVILHFKSARNHGVNFLVNVYGR